LILRFKIKKLYVCHHAKIQNNFFYAILKMFIGADSVQDLE